MSLSAETFERTFKNNPEELNEFLSDIILKKLSIEIPFETKYKALIDKCILIDFICITDIIINYSLRFLGNNTYSLDEYQKDFPIKINDINFISYFYHFSLINYEKLNLVKSRSLTNFSPNALTDFNVNFQVTFSHQNYGFLDEPSALVQLFTKRKNDNNNHILELNPSELESFIQKLKEIHKNLI